MAVSPAPEAAAEWAPAAQLGGAGGGGGIFDSGPSGFWRFDDCSPGSHFLLDSSGNNFSAQHALNGFCVDGISGLGVKFTSQKDVVQVPDEPQFTVGPRIAVAEWVKPTTVDGDQPIVIKRENKTTAFSLGIHKEKIEMAVTHRGPTASPAPGSCGPCRTRR
jgi:hypothetical protein